MERRPLCFHANAPHLTRRRRRALHQQDSSRRRMGSRKRKVCVRLGRPAPGFAAVSPVSGTPESDKTRLGRTAAATNGERTKSRRDSCGPVQSSSSFAFPEEERKVWVGSSATLRQRVPFVKLGGSCCYFVAARVFAT